MVSVRLVLEILLIITQVTGQLDTVKLATILSHNIGNKLLGFQDLQDKIYKINVQIEKVNPQVVFKKIHDDLTDKFASTFSVVNNTVATILNDYNTNAYGTSTEVDFNECCKFIPTEENSSNSFTFKQWINIMSSCYRFAELDHNNATIAISLNLVDTARRNMHIASNTYIRWQYYGTVEGVSSQYPESNSVDCDDYDPRYRPWFSRVVSSMPKDVVFVIDRSHFMKLSPGGYAMAKRAVNITINSLAPYDKFSVVLFSRENKTPPGCNQIEMAVNTKLNRKRVLDFMNNYKTTDEAPDFMKSLQFAFNVLNNKNDSEKRNKIIFFITPGETSEPIDLILNKIRDLNMKMNNSVIILTFGIGNVKDEQLYLLTGIANQRKSDPAYGPIRRGVYQQVITETLEKQFMTYYINLNNEIGEETMVSEPYYDYSNIGLIMTAAKAVVHNGKFMGVAGVDLQVTDLFVNLLYFNEGSNSYVFIINKAGRTLMHPLMVSIETTDEVEFVDINNFEHGDKVTHIIDNMKRGKTGRSTINRMQAISLGDPKRQGMRYINITVEYIYKMIEGTDLSVCVVIASDSHVVSEIYSNYNVKNLHYHLELIKDENVCALANDHVGVTDYSIVKFAGWIFHDATIYFNYPELEKIDYYNSFFTGSSSKYENIKYGVKQLVYASAILDAIWKKSFNGGEVTWLYVSFVNGIFRLYPGEILSKLFDPSQRDWYKMALANPREIILTPPYYDQGNMGIVVTMSITLHDSIRSSFTLGVMGIDFTLFRLEQIILSSNPKCNLEENICFIMESSGNIVYHESFTKGAISTFVHISEKEPEVAINLINGNYLKNHSSVDFNSRRRYYTWSVNIIQALDRLSNNGIKYRIEKILNTNSFLGIVKKSSRSVTKVACHNIPKNRITTEECIEDPIRIKCFSPCYISKLDSYNECQNTFDRKSDISIPSEPSIKYVRPSFGELDKVRALRKAGKICTQTSCNNFYSKGKCEYVDGCKWCKSEVNSNDKCIISTSCFIKKVENPSSNTLAIVIGIIATLLLIVLVVVMFYYWRRWTSASRVAARNANKNRQQITSRTDDSPVEKEDVNEDYHNYEEIKIENDWTANRAYQRHNEVKTQLPLGTDSVPNGDVVDDTYASLDSSSEHEDYEMHRSQEADLKTGDSHVNPVYESHDNL